MTAPDPRVGEECCLGCPDCGPIATKRTMEAIAHRLGKVSEGPWTAWDRGIGYEVHNTYGEPINSGHRETFARGDAEFIAMAPGDVYFLLAELRKAHEALARVEGLHFAVGDPDHSSEDTCFECLDTHPCPTVEAIRAAVAAANGDGL